MRMAGIPLTIATIPLGSTVLGATENDQVHFFYHFQEGRSSGSLTTALVNAMLVAGRRACRHSHQYERLSRARAL